jgi:hypothetical protein
MCDHKYVYAGVRFVVDQNPLSGTGAKRRRYYDAYYCEKCLEMKYKEIMYEDTTYDGVAFSATPMPR